MDQRRLNAVIVAFTLIMVVFQLVSGGCAMLTFTAEDRVNDKVVIRSVGTVKTAFLDVKGSGPESAILELQEKIAARLKEEGFDLVTSPEKSDLKIAMEVGYHKKRVGQLWLVFFVIPWNDPFSQGGWDLVDGWDIHTTFQTSAGKSSKVYRTYPGGGKNGRYGFGEFQSAFCKDIRQLKAEISAGGK